MKIFETTQKHFGILGIRPSNQDHAFNKRILFGFLLFGCFVPLYIVYIFHVADDFMEYVESICVISANIVTFICLSAVVLQRNVIFESIESIDKLIAFSEKEFLHSKRQTNIYITYFHFCNFQEMSVPNLWNSFQNSTRKLNKWVKWFFCWKWKCCLWLWSQNWWSALAITLSRTRGVIHSNCQCRCGKLCSCNSILIKSSLNNSFVQLY